MRLARTRLAVRLFGLAAFALVVLSALGASEPWAM
jgi:hypothetical protein